MSFLNCECFFFWQIRRLESALEQENKPAADTADGGISRKRGRDSQDGDCNGPEKIRSTDKFRDMNIKQLREQAKFQGVSTVGTMTKKQLLEMLCKNFSDNNDTLQTLHRTCQASLFSFYIYIIDNNTASPLDALFA